MKINFNKSVGTYLRQVLIDRGLDKLKKKELWELLKITHSHETYRKIIFED